MITLASIRDWIKSLDVGKNFYIGKLDNKKDKSVGIYQREGYGGVNMAIGGIDATKTAVKNISILIHWNKNANETEQAAQSLYDKLLRIKDVTINDHHIDYLYLAVPEPVDIGTDDKGVYERVIWIDLYYQRKEEN